MATCEGDSCGIDAIVTIDVKGQIVLPKDLTAKEKELFAEMAKVSSFNPRKG